MCEKTVLVIKKHFIRFVFVRVAVTVTLNVVTFAPSVLHKLSHTDLDRFFELVAEVLEDPEALV